jgi:type IV pilus assembly protein PilF
MNNMKRLGSIGVVLTALSWSGLLAGMLAVGGCAAPNTEQARPADQITESDEPEHRRRARIRMELAVGYFEQGKTSIALDELKQVILADPTFPDAFNLRGLIYMRLNDMALAEDSFRRAVVLNPRDANTLHNLGWLQCQQRRYDDAQQSFEQALNSPISGDRGKTLMALGLCQARAGRPADAERSLAKAYELDAGNPIVGYNLANLLYGRGDLQRAQFYIRRLNNSDMANAETLWLGMKVERKIGDQLALVQLSDQLRKRFPQSRQTSLLDKGAFDD